MYLDLHNIDIPEFETKQKAKEWIKGFLGVRLWHATRILDPEDIRLGGLQIPTKNKLDARLLSWIKIKSWYSSEVDSIIRDQPLKRGESLAVYGVLDKNDLSLNGIDHYKKYGSEYWQFLLEVLAGKGYGSGKQELLTFGQSCIVGIDIRWDSLESSEIGYIVESIIENDIHNSAIAIFNDISPNEIASIELC